MKQQLDNAIKGMDRSTLLSDFAARKAKVIRKLEVMRNDMKIKRDIDDDKKKKSAGYLFVQLVKGNKRSVRMMAVGEGATKNMMEIAEKFSDMLSEKKHYSSLNKPYDGYRTITV